LFPAIRCFPAVLAAALQAAPVIIFTAIFTSAPVRGGKRFVNYTPVGYPQPAFTLPPVFVIPAFFSGPAFPGTAAAVIPADTGTPAAGICTAIHRIKSRYVRVFFLTHGNLEIHSQTAVYYKRKYTLSPPVHLRRLRPPP
jgi:hypothetical protein